MRPDPQLRRDVAKHLSSAAQTLNGISRDCAIVRHLRE